MMRLGRLITLLGAIAIFGGRTTAWGQARQVTIPDGARHFIVLVDSSKGMVQSKSQTDPDAKNKALIDAKADLTSMLFSPKSGQDLPGYRRGRDRITVVQFGIGVGKHENLANERLKTARLDEDYARRITHAESKMSARRFGLVINPRTRTQFDILPWAIPLGVFAASVPNYMVQETYIVLLTDSRFLDPQTTDRSKLAASYLNKSAQNRLTKRLKQFDELVQLVPCGGGNVIWSQRIFGFGEDKIVIAAAKLLPLTTEKAVSAILESHPLAGLQVERELGGFMVSLSPKSGLLGVKSKLELRSGSSEQSKEFAFEENQRLHMGEVGGFNADAALTVTQRAANPLLGRQEFQLQMISPVALPAARLLTRCLWMVLTSILIGFGGYWAYYQAVLARHLQLWLPGYVTSFRLPPLSQRVNSRHLIRIPVEVGDVSAILILPSPFVRYVFYRGATLHWDARLRVPALPPDAVSAKMTQLPRVTKFICVDRTHAAGEFELVLERITKNKRNHRAQINVRFLSLPNSSRSALE